jgi:hypothetical protein
MSSAKRNHIRLLLLGALAALSFQAFGRAASDPLSREWGTSLERDLTRLPDSGRLDPNRFPWSDTFVEGDPALVSRWYRTEFAPAERFRRRPPYLDELTKMDAGTRSRVASELSSAQIFDLLRGRSDYPLEKEVRSVLKSRDARFVPEWLNFGWAAAATSFREPNAVSRHARLPTGHALDLEVGSTDVKSLSAWYYGVVARDRVQRYQVGSRCHGPEDRRCGRIDPASFHVLLANSIRENGFSFVADIDPSAKVDYRPIGAFDADLRVEPEAGSSGNRIYRVKTTVEYAKRRLPQKAPYGFFNLDADRETYEYTLVVGRDGRIEGGEWLSERRPEFVWRVKQLPTVDLAWAKLKEIYEEAPLDSVFGKLAGTSD